MLGLPRALGDVTFCVGATSAWDLWAAPASVPSAAAMTDGLCTEMVKQVHNKGHHCGLKYFYARRERKKRLTAALTLALALAEGLTGLEGKADTADFFGGTMRENKESARAKIE